MAFLRNRKSENTTSVDGPLRPGPAVSHAAHRELEQVDAFPAHRQLEHTVQLAQWHGLRYEDAAPDHRADVQQPNLDLQNGPQEHCRLHRLHNRKLRAMP